MGMDAAASGCGCECCCRHHMSGASGCWSRVLVTGAGHEAGRTSVSVCTTHVARLWRVKNTHTHAHPAWGMGATMACRCLHIHLSLHWLLRVWNSSSGKETQQLDCTSKHTHTTHTAGLKGYGYLSHKLAGYVVEKVQPKHYRHEIAAAASFLPHNACNGPQCTQHQRPGCITGEHMHTPGWLAHTDIFCAQKSTRINARTSPSLS